MEELSAETDFQEAKGLRGRLWATHMPAKLAEQLGANWDKVEVEIATKVIAALKDKPEVKQARDKRVLLMRRAMLLRYRTEKDGSESEWREIRRHLGNNRFCMTLLLAAAQRVVLREKTLLEGARKAEALIFNTVNEIRNVSVEQREQTVLRAVLDSYARFHVIGDPENDIELHQKLLRSLAVIGSPVSANVLVRLPDIRAYFRDAKAEFNISRRRTISRALHTLAHRGCASACIPIRRSRTASTIPPAPTTGAGPQTSSIASRFTGSSSATGFQTGQRHGRPGRDQQLLALALRLDALGLPRLSHEAYEYLRGLLVGLSQYPDIPHSEQRFEPWLFRPTTRRPAWRPCVPH
ncbi:MAG: hypothetical protein HPM95_06970 [Alphaproteobacteria bacterium]|nr:hypothetical protein [Alphaproteobacteria bacterium]